MKMTKFLVINSVILALSFSLISLTIVQQKPWPVPDKEKNAKNPKKADKASTDKGKATWDKMCKSCHGGAGLGDGPKAKGLKTPAGDFSKELTSQTDGELFYKTATGRDEMPKYKGRLGDNDIWDLVNFMRTMKK
jgi:mono/diheme cytochrome c family protein